MGEWKPLLPFGDTTILQRVVAVALAACGRVVLVTGFKGDELSVVFKGERRVLIVENPDWPWGMFSSLQRGAAAVDTERFFVTLGDMPWIRPDVYTALLQAPACDVVFPVFGGRRGHPVLFNGGVKREIAREDPARGSMQAVVSRLASFDLPWDDDSIHRDVDTPADLG
jgi:molybdenum cofactor cytidylyltransferase